ncbi:restriction endonuclease subunit S [Sinorhizobium numidicum]|uniref:Restriction endonuclease subunit S n=1 Tax=Sinorhizobium numidicum TaxID=680248 RepID=A0ABY8D3C1_9HYPH|nr:restriction endonuclease subunit S [Sinorhizobium numidicum]WEX77953.1 restriction endonuclease subunit S [Sinorhizobium numidicum]WEX84612.1 restriction endonuclease subunit S [Sinorhizobium numidicum]
MSEMPRRWTGATIEDVTHYVQRGKSPKYVPHSELPVINQKCVRWSGVDEAHLKYVDPSQWSAWGEERFLRDGDILWNSTGTGTIGRAAIFRGLTTAQRVVADSHVTIVRANGAVLPDYLHRLIQSPSVQSKLDDMQSGSTNQVELSKAEVLATPVPLAPLPEQQRIVAKIDSLTGKSRRAREHLDHIPRLVEKYKQAVLAAAFRGDLTREWRRRYGDIAPVAHEMALQRAELAQKYRQKHYDCNEVFVANGSEPFAVPTAWNWVRAEAICGFITKGTTPHASQLQSGTGDVPFIKVYNLTFDGSLNFTVEPTFVSRSTHEGFLARSRVLPNDVLMNIVGPPLGKVSIVPSDAPEWNINQAIAVFRTIPSVSAAFLAKWLLADDLVQWGVSRSKATAGQSNLTLAICRDLPIPLCSLREQQQITRRIDTAFTWIDRLASEATNAHKLIDHLDQAVLVKAFRGELIPQDPDDEPASVLLDRIRAERGAAPKGNQGRTKQS